MPESTFRKPLRQVLAAASCSRKQRRYQFGNGGPSLRMATFGFKAISWSNDITVYRAGRREVSLVAGHGLARWYSRPDAGLLAIRTFVSRPQISQ